MKRNTILVTVSLLSILFMTFHLADDIVRGFEKGGLSNLAAVPIFVVWLYHVRPLPHHALDLLAAVPIFVVWLYGTLLLAGRPSGYVIMLLGSLLGLAAPFVHFMGKGVGGEIAKSSGGFFFVWTLIALGVTALFSLVLSVCGLWRRE